MADNKVDIERIRKFLEKSKSDLVSAEILLKEDQLEDSCYFSQQAAEKAVKAYLILKGKFLKIHTPSGKFGEILEKEKSDWKNKLSNTKNKMKFLERYWIEPRYPDIPHEEYTKEIAKEALEKAESVFNTLKEFLEEEYDIESEEENNHE